MRSLLVLALAAQGCALGAGPWQPGREKFSMAGATDDSLEGSDESRQADHQEAKTKRLPDLLGTTSMYYFNDSMYGGMKQGASFAVGDDKAKGSKFFMEMHLDLLHLFDNDWIALGATLFAAGYGTGDTGSEKLAYSAGGVGGIVKLKLAQSLGLHLGAGFLYGRLDVAGTTPMGSGGIMSEHADLTGERALAGFDWAWFHLLSAEVVLSVEGQYVQTKSATLLGEERAFKGAAIAAEIALAAY